MNEKTPNLQTQAAMKEARAMAMKGVPEPAESTVGVESFPSFTKPARQRWESIPADIRKRLLSNVWCGHCRHETTITNFSVIDRQNRATDVRHIRASGKGRNGHFFGG